MTKQEHYEKTVSPLFRTYAENKTEANLEAYCKALVQHKMPSATPEAKEKAMKTLLMMWGKR